MLVEERIQAHLGMQNQESKGLFWDQTQIHLEEERHWALDLRFYVVHLAGN